MNLEVIQTDEPTMTLKEITDLLNTRHNDAMDIVEKMSENEDFGLVTKTSYPITSGKGRVQHIETYRLNKMSILIITPLAIKFIFGIMTPV